MTKIPIGQCKVCGKIVGVGHRCLPPKSAGAMREWIEMNAMDPIHEAWDILVRYYLHESDAGKHLDEIDQAHLLESIRLKIEFDTVNPDEVMEWVTNPEVI